MNWEIVLAAVAVGATLFSHARAVWDRVTGVVLIRYRCDADTAGVVLSFLGGKSGRVRAYNSSRSFFVKPLEKLARVFWQDRQYTDGAVYWYRHRPVWMQREKKDSVTGYESTFTTLRWTLDFEQLLLDSGDWEEENRGQSSHYVRHRVVHHHGRTLGELSKKGEDEDSPGSTKKFRHVWSNTCGDRLLRWDEAAVGLPPTSTFEGLAIMPNVADLADEVRQWFGLRSWYVEHLLAWRRGYALTGAPGTGKTTFVREVSAELDLPVHVMDLATMSNEDLRASWDAAQADAPCVILCEDVDGVFDGRANVAKFGGLMSSGGLTFDCLLNCVDGVQRSDGVLLFMTTNRADKLDEALTRPGRLDRTVEFGPLDLERRRKLAARIVGAGARADRVALESGDLPASQFLEACCRQAIAEMYEMYE